MSKCFIFLIICISLFGCQSIQRKSFKKKLDKNKLERCILREKNKCNSKKEICKLYDRRDNKECQNEFDECIKKSILECEKQYH